MKDSNSPLLEAVLTLKSRVGNFSAQEYELATGKAWDFTYDESEIRYFGEDQFKSIRYQNKQEEGETFTFCYPYVLLNDDQDALLDLYLILQEMKNFQESLEAKPYWKELGVKKLRTKKKNGIQNQLSIAGTDFDLAKPVKVKRNSNTVTKSTDTHD